MRDVLWTLAAIAVAACAYADLPAESLPALETAKQAVAQGDWGAAIDAYAEHLGLLTTRDYRDKKTFDWILEAFERAAAATPPDYEALKAIAKGKLPKQRSKADPVLTWRLHLLLSRIAQRQGNEAEVRQELDSALWRYPDVTYPEPDVQSRVQHIYNEIALIQAKQDAAEAEEYLVSSFLKDARFAYIYLPPWREFYTATGTPEKFDALVKRILDTYDQKARNLPNQADALRHYRRLIQEEFAPKE